MAIQIIDNFQLNKPIPLDHRVIVNNLTDLPVRFCYQGMIVFQKSDKKFYKFIDGAFELLISTVAAVTEFNGRTGNVSVVAGPGISISEIDPGVFEISATASSDLDLHSTTVASFNVLGHVKLDDDSIKKDVADRIYLNSADGGSF